MWGQMLLREDQAWSLEQALAYPVQQRRQFNPAYNFSKKSHAEHEM